MMRSHLECANAVWNPYREGPMKDTKEYIQIRATKLVSGLRIKELQEETTGAVLNRIFIHY